MADGLVVQSAAQNLLLTVTPKQRAEQHALEIVADANSTTPSPPSASSPWRN